MNLLTKSFAAITFMAAFSFTEPVAKPVTKESAKIQVAILLDVSGSMEGLIKQAKEQLWNMVTTLGNGNVVIATPAESF